MIIFPHPFRTFFNLVNGLLFNLKYCLLFFPDTALLNMRNK